MGEYRLPPPPGLSIVGPRPRNTLYVAGHSVGAVFTLPYSIVVAIALMEEKRNLAEHLSVQLF
jgi:hypothetical protein